MKILTAFFVAALLFASSAMAQTTQTATVEASGSFIVNTNVMNGGIGPNGQPLARAKGKPATGDVINEITWMRGTNGTVHYTIKTETIKLIDGAETWPTRTVFNTIAAAAVVQGNNLGITQCTNNCTSVVATVTANSCVERSGTGFVVINPTLFSNRAYTVCCDPGGAWVTLLNVEDPGCTVPGSIQ
jgi:hypothetical protein